MSYVIEIEHWECAACRMEYESRHGAETCCFPEQLESEWRCSGCSTTFSDEMDATLCECQDEED